MTAGSCTEMVCDFRWLINDGFDFGHIKNVWGFKQVCRDGLGPRAGAHG